MTRKPRGPEAATTPIPTAGVLPRRYWRATIAARRWWTCAPDLGAALAAFARVEMGVAADFVTIGAIDADAAARVVRDDGTSLADAPLGVVFNNGAR